MSDPGWKNAITDVPGIRVGHCTDREHRTGLTVVLCDGDAVAGADLRGSACGTRQFDSLLGFHVVSGIQAVLFTGGSAFGLDATGGVMRFLEENNRGLTLYQACIPTVPTAVIFDLFLGRRRPDAEMAYRACVTAGDGPVEIGSVGAGTGATIGKLSGAPWGMKGGVGTESTWIGPGVKVGVLVVVNAFGDVIDTDGTVLAGARTGPEGEKLARMGKVMMEGENGKAGPGECTTLGVVATDAKLDRDQAIKVAEMAQDGIARAIAPAHSVYDGDLLICLSLGEKAADLNALGHAAAELTARAIRSGVRAADGFGVLPAFRDLGA